MKNEENKILIVITLFSIGGATETVISLASGLKKRGYHVDIITGQALKNEGDMFAEANTLGLNVIVLNELVRNINPFYDVVTLFRLLKIIKVGKYSVVHTHSSKAGVIGRIAAWLQRVPIIVHTIHGLPYHNYQARALTRSYIMIERLCAKLSTKIVSVTHAIIENCLNNKISSRDKFIVIRSGLQLDNYTSNDLFREKIRKQYGFQEKDIVAGVISRIAPLKGHEYIITVAKRIKNEFPSLKFFLVGDGESGLLVKNIVEKNKLENIIKFSGMVSPDEIPKMISAMDFIIHPSLREGLARVLPQSIIMGKRVISFNLDGVDEVIVDGVSGYAVEIGNSDALLEACLNVCKKDIYKNIDDSFRVKIQQEFDSNTMVDQHVELYMQAQQ